MEGLALFLPPAHDKKGYMCMMPNFVDGAPMEQVAKKTMPMAR